MQSIKKRRFTLLGDVLNTILEKNNLGHLYTLEEIKKRWVSFDKTIAAHARPVEYDFHTGLLTLQVDNLIWKREFQENSETLKVKIKNEYRTIKIAALKII